MKVGLVLEGGAMRGLYTAGVLDVFMYNNIEVDKIIAVICEQDNEEKLKKTLFDLAEEECSDQKVQVRKWNVCLLKNLIESNKEDALQCLLELMEFWLSTEYEGDCPHFFPNEDESFKTKNYFSRSVCNLLIEKNLIWIDEEIKAINALEKGMSSLA